MKLTAPAINEGKSTTLVGTYNPGTTGPNTVTATWGDGTTSTATATDVIDRSKVLALYTFDGNANDASGNGHNGTVVNATLTTQGYEGSAYSFNGTNAYINVPVNINPSVYPRLTMGAWVNAASSTAVREILLARRWRLRSQPQGIDSRGGGTTTNGYWSAFTGSGVLGGSPAITNLWVFVAVVYDQTAGTETLYVNGYPYSTANVTEGPGRTSLFIGSNSGFGEFFQGIIDDVFVYADTMSASQIAAVSTLGSSAFTSSTFALTHQYLDNPTSGSTYTVQATITDGNLASNLPAGSVGYWPGDGNANDLSGNGNNGTLENGATFAQGHIGQAFSLDGVDDWISTNQTFTNDQSNTVAAWVYWNGSGSAFQEIASWWNPVRPGRRPHVPGARLKMDRGADPVW